MSRSIISINNNNINDKITMIDRKLISQGAFGKVYKSRHIIDNQDYAIKIIPIEGNIIHNNILKEVRYLASLKHPNIIRYFNCWIELTNNYKNMSNTLTNFSKTNLEITNLENNNKYQICIQTELMHMNVYDYLLNFNPTLNSKKYIYKYILKAVSYLHRQKPKVIHCDIKPSNILINIDPVTNKPIDIKLSDFGLITICGKTNMLLKYYGTDLYTDPILLESSNPKPSTKTDIYSLGILGFELFNSYKTRMETIKQINMFKLHKIKTNSIIDSMISSDLSVRPDIDSILNLL